MSRKSLVTKSGIKQAFLPVNTLDSAVEERYIEDTTTGNLTDGNAANFYVREEDWGIGQPFFLTSFNVYVQDNAELCADYDDCIQVRFQILAGNLTDIIGESVITGMTNAAFSIDGSNWCIHYHYQFKTTLRVEQNQAVHLEVTNNTGQTISAGNLDVTLRGYILI